jgi:hypothetical protein
MGIQQHEMSLSCLLGFMLRADKGCIRRVLLGMGVVPIAHDKDKDYGNGAGVKDGNHIEEDNDGDDAVRGKFLSSYLLWDAKQIRQQECGAVQ